MNPPNSTEGWQKAVVGLLAASLLINVVLMANQWGGDDAEPQAVVQELPPEAVRPAVEGEVGVARIGQNAVEPSVLSVRAPVAHSLARTFQSAVPEHADVVSAIYSRLFVWDLDLRRDVLKGDEVALAYSWDGQLADIAAASYTSIKAGRTLRAYRFTATGDNWPSWWDEAGTEVPRRLVNGPLRDYEQVTSLLKDRPTHAGMDFKTPVGTPVYSPRAGKITRTNWNLGPNGNCIEVRFSDGVVARFLHLSDVKVQPGDEVTAGSMLGLSGNTGRSTAPHLHYELERGGKVLDPVDYHGVIRRKLTEADEPRFAQERDQLQKLLERDQQASL